MKRPLLYPLAPLYWVGLRVKNALCDRSVLRSSRLQSPVISVGSLSAGGAGKTPVVLMLADLLARHGVAVDVLSRGYGRRASAAEEVDPAGDAERFGDEPLEMARRGVKVFVGADRFAAGTLAEKVKAGPFAALRDDKQRIHLLDDGFQHRQLQRDLDIVLLTVEDIRDHLLPAGNLREPLALLARADVVVVREDEANELAAVIAASTRAGVWVIRRELTLPPGGPRNPLAFCGIARPDGFLAMLPAVAAVKAFPDHHAYTPQDFAALVEAARKAGADGFVTTAKDAVKIAADARKTLEAVGPIAIAELRVTLLDEARAWQRLEPIVRR